METNFVTQMAGVNVESDQYQVGGAGRSCYIAILRAATGLNKSEGHIVSRKNNV
jgi:hypothetical protein